MSRGAGQAMPAKSAGAWTRLALVLMLLNGVWATAPARAQVPAPAAGGRTITILAADRLELRNVTPPGGGAAEEYVIITGERVLVRVDDDELEGTRIEYNKTRRTLRVVGDGVFRSAAETVAGRDFTVDLADESLAGEDVLVVTSEIDVSGVSVERLPGQIDVDNGYFSPCGRCNQNPNDYAFRAERLTIYPGDRLIGRNVTLLLADEPVLFLPIVVIFLNDPSRQPRFSFTDDALDGRSVELDLPFVTGSFGLGFTLLRYFEYRDPPVGLGFDYTLYDVFGLSNRTRLFFLLLPPRNQALGDGFIGTQPTGALFGYRIDTRGRIPLTPGADPAIAWPDLTFAGTVARTDEGIEPRELRGLDPGPSRRTDYSLELGLESPRFGLQLVLSGFIDNRDLLAIPEQERRFGLPLVPQYQPELRGRLGSAANVRLGPLALRSFAFSFGSITAPYDPLNRSARLLAGDSPYVTAGRAAVAHALAFLLEPWAGASLSVENDFRGQYYDTRNPGIDGALGEPERAVVFNVRAGFRQALFGNAITLGLGYTFGISEGESPFSFDRIPRRPPTETGFAEIGLQPFPWVGLTARQTIDFRRREFGLDPAVIILTLSPAPLNAGATLTYDLAAGEPVSFTVRASNSVPAGVSFSVATGYRYAAEVDRRRNPNVEPGWDDLDLTVGYRSPPDGRFSVSVNLRDNLNTGEIRSWTLASTLVVGSSEAPAIFSLNQSLVPPQYTNQLPAPPAPFARLSGSFSVGYAGVLLTVQDALDFRPWEPTPASPVPPSSLSVTLASSGRTAPGGGGISWSVRYGGQLDLDPFAFFNPTISGSLNARSSALDLALAATVLAPSTTQSNFELSQATARVGWDVLPGIAVQGSLAYARSRPTAPDFLYRDSYTLTPFGVTFAFAREAQPRPELFLSVLLRGTYQFTYGDPNQTLPFYNNGREAFRTTFRPVFVLTIDRCCYALQLSFDSTPQRGASFRFDFLLPAGGRQGVIEADPAGGIRFPLLPFVPPVGGSAP